MMKYVIRLSRPDSQYGSMYVGNGTLKPVADINQAKVFNRPESIRQTSVWHSYGGEIIPVQVNIVEAGEAVEYAAPALEDILTLMIERSLGVVQEA